MDEIFGLITKNFLENILKEAYNEKIVVIDFFINSASVEGNHYFSNVKKISVNFYRVKSIEKKENLKFVFKLKNSNGFFEKIFKCSAKESQIYCKILNEINLLLKKNISPKLISCVGNKLILLEDLSLNYQLKNREEMLDCRHCLAALQLLAKYHAATIKLNQLNHELILWASDEYMYTDRSVQRYFVKNCFDLFTKSLNDIKDGEQYVDSLEKYSKTIWAKLLKLIKPSSNGINALTHGDFWTTNIFFKYNFDDGPIEDVKLIDFQTCRYGSVWLDLHMFINTSVQENVRNSNLNELLNNYLITLNDTLMEINSNIRMTEEEFEKQRKDTIDFGLFCAVCLLPICTLDVNDPLDLREANEINYIEMFKNMINPFEKMYKKDNYKKKIIKLLEYYKKENVF